MSTERRKRLFFVLAVVLTVSVMAAVTGRGIERLRTAEEKSGQYRTQIARLRQSLQMQSQSASRRQQLEDQMKIARARFYPPGEIDPYSFGTMVRKRLAAEGMRVIRYQVVEIKGRSGLEFTVSGPIRSLVLFLKEVSESQKYWSMTSLTLTMREGISVVEAVFRIGYEELAS
jgi:hypothetical protein